MHKARDFGGRKWSIAVPLGLFWRSQETTLRKNFKIRRYLPISAVKPLIINPIDLHKKKMKSTTYYKPLDKWSSTKIKQ